MARTEEIGGQSLQKFLDVWSRHPLALFAVIIFMDFAFLFMLFLGKIDPSVGLKMTLYTFVFSATILLFILLVLFKKRKVLYNALDLLTNFTEHRIHRAEDSLQNIEIGVGDPYEEKLEWLCPNSATTAPNMKHFREEVLVLDSLKHLLVDCGLEINTNCKTKLALAKFFYKDGNFPKALEKICEAESEEETKPKGKKENTKIEAIRPGDLDFCKGLILRQLHREPESQVCFAKVKDQHADAKCWECVGALPFGEKEENVQRFIDLAKTCPGSRGQERCMNKLSTAFYTKATLFSSDKSERELNLRKAIEVADEVIEKFDSCFANFNRACDVSVMARFGISFNGRESFEEDQEAMKMIVIEGLRKSFQARPALVRYSMEEKDLKWIRENYGPEFNQLIGDTYRQHYTIL